MIHAIKVSTRERVYRPAISRAITTAPVQMYSGVSLHTFGKV